MNDDRWPGAWVVALVATLGCGPAAEGISERDGLAGARFEASATWTIPGAQVGADFGTTVASAGDVDGDGYDEVLVGAPTWANPEFSEGAAFLHRGSASGVESAAAWSWESDVSLEAAGSALASAGDVNGDGFDDVIVGNRGSARVFTGSAAGLDPIAAWASPARHAGAEVAGAGDVNGDGYDDILVGGCAEKTGRRFPMEGVAVVYLGSAAGPGAVPSWVTDGGQYLAQHCSVAAAGDVNADGYDDVLVGARGYTNGHLSEGRSSLYLGSAGGLATTPAWIADGDQLTASFGDGRGVGDVNGDGHADVVVGAAGWAGVAGADTGEARLYLGNPSGLDAVPVWRVEGEAPGDFFGREVAGAGDVDGDGYDDVVISAFGHGAGGRASLWLGSATGLAVEPAWDLTGDAGDGLGWSVAGAGDVDGDGLADVLVGTAPGSGDLGMALVVAGTPP